MTPAIKPPGIDPHGSVQRGNLSTSPVRLTRIQHAIGTYTLTIAGHTTTPLAYNATAAMVKAALLALSLVNVTNIVVNRAGDTFTVGFLGNELLDPATLTLTGNPTGLDQSGDIEPKAIVVTAWSQSLTQAVDVHAAGGTFTVTIGAGLGHFDFSASGTADQFRDALINAIRLIPGNPISADGIQVGVKEILVDKVGSAYLVTYLGLLRGPLGDVYGLSVPPVSELHPTASYQLTLNAVGGTFTLGTDLTRAPMGATATWSLGFNAAGAQIADALKRFTT